jgi:hypothetical protein
VGHAPSTKSRPHEEPPLHPTHAPCAPYSQALGNGACRRACQSHVASPPSGSRWRRLGPKPPNLAAPCRPPGNAYALLACWRATRDPLWLARAQRFAAFIGEGAVGGGGGDWGAPDHPLSLFEGLGGALVLLSDLLADAEGARFPFYEV